MFVARLVVEGRVDEVVPAVVGAARMLDEPDGRALGRGQLDHEVAHPAVGDAPEGHVQVPDRPGSSTPIVDVTPAELSSGIGSGGAWLRMLVSGTPGSPVGMRDRHDDGPWSVVRASAAVTSAPQAAPAASVADERRRVGRRGARGDVRPAGAVLMNVRSGPGDLTRTRRSRSDRRRCAGSPSSSNCSSRSR